MRSRRPVIPILAVCHRDTAAALRWLTWASYLAQQAGGDVSGHTLVVFVTRRVAANGTDQFLKAILPSKKFFNVEVIQCQDENEAGYPLSANHLFLRALEFAEQNHHEMNPLFIEADCVPIEPDWFTSIQAEYDSHDAAFMGGLTEGGHPHMTGNAVYDKEWRHIAPSIATVLERKDSGGMFRAGLGFPFDLWIANDVLKSFHRAQTIFQVWSPGQWHSGNLGRIQHGSKLVHQDKTGTLILTTARTKFPGFLEHMPRPNSFYMLTNPSPKFTVDGMVFEFTPCSRTPDGAWWSVLRPDTYEDEMVLSSAAGRLGMEAISESDYKALLSQRK